MRGFAIAVTVVAGCGGGIDSDLEGVYRIETWTDNPAACVEGPSVLVDRGDTALYLQAQSLFGTDFLNAETCVDVPTCRSIALAGDSFGLGLTDGSDADGWTGTGAETGSDGAGGCQGARRDFLLTGGPTIRIEIRTVASRPFSTDSDGFCTTDDALAAAEGQPCTSLEVITATFDSAIQ